MLAASPVQAATWTARKPAEIQITKGQKVYTIQWGDTLSEYFRDVEGQDVLLFIDNIFHGLFCARP